MGIGHGVYTWLLVSILYFVILIGAFGIIGFIFSIIILIVGIVIIVNIHEKTNPNYRFNKRHSEPINMICPVCKTALPAGANACPSCGRII